jgi:plasmid stabilization system protein ParE
MRVVFHQEAHAEIIEQARYYENKSEGLGADFLDAVEEAARRIGQSPQAGPVEQANIRKL